MKTLLKLTTSIVAASLAIGFSNAAAAQSSNLQLSGEISLGWAGFDSDTSGSGFANSVDEQIGNMDFSFDVTASAPEHGLNVFGYADLSTETDSTDFSNLEVHLRSAAIGVSGAQGAALVRIGARETEYAYASDLAVGGAGASTKFIDETFGSEAPFNSIELIYAHAQGPLSFSGSFEPESGKMSAAAGYDFLTTYGPARINGYVFEDQLNNDSTTNAISGIDAIRGYRVAAFVDNGALEIGGNVAVEDVDFAGSNAHMDRISMAIGAVMQIQANLDVSIDFEHTEIDTNTGSDEYNAFSVGAELGIGDAMTVGGYFRQYEDATAMAVGATDGLMRSGSEIGANVAVTF